MPDLCQERTAFGQYQLLYDRQPAGCKPANGYSGACWRTSVTRKLAPAKEFGLAVLLLLDQVHDPSQKAVAQWIFVHDTLRQVLETLLPPSENVVDEIWLRTPDQSCLPLRPAELPANVDGLDYLWR